MKTFFCQEASIVCEIAKRRAWKVTKRVTVLFLTIHRKIKSMARRNEEFNEFLKNFKAKNE